jgi:hypothetical protein
VNNDHEQVLNALFTLLKNAVVVSFTAGGSINTPTLTGVSSVAGLFNGLPVFGPSVPKGTVISSFDATAMTITLSQNLSANVSAASAFTTGFQTASRRVRLWTDVLSIMPCLYMRHVTDKDDYVQTILQRTTIDVEIWIYSNAGQDPNLAPDITLNNLCTAVRNALKPDYRGAPQTLGGLVQWARVEGESTYDPGDLDKFSKALIPVKVLCP